jgi:hypothetical protein
MAHYAFLNEENIVTEVIVGIDETELIEGLDPKIWYSNFRNQSCKRTSYNNRIRGNYAGTGMIYCEEHDLFMHAQCHNEALLNVETASWDCNSDEHKIAEQ